MNGRINLMLDQELQLIAIFLCCHQFINQAFRNSIWKCIVECPGNVTA